MIPKGAPSGLYKNNIHYDFSGSLSLLANGSSQLTFQVDAGYNYIARRWTYFSDAPFSIRISDNDKKLMSNPVPSQCLVGYQNAGDTIRAVWLMNNFYPRGYMFTGGNNIVIDLSDTSGAPNVVNIYITGFKILK